MDTHEHQFPEEETPTGVRLLLPCLLCGLSALDAMALVKQEREDLLVAAKAVRETCPCDNDITKEFNAAWNLMLAAIAKAGG